MSKSEVVHSTFVIERTYPASPARVFAAFADTSIKKRWFLEKGVGSNVDSYAADFRVGGVETSRFRFAGDAPGAPPPGTIMGNDTVYLDIVENERVVFAYAMLVGERRMSASLATVVLSPAGKGTRLTFTEQAAFFDASDGPLLRKNGWTELLAKIDRAVEE